jgi:hypothetical protein
VRRRALTGPVLAGLLLAGLATGCVDGGEVATDIGRQPTCASGPGTVQRGLLIMAQAVPGAEWLPCIRTVPQGWTFDEIRPRDGEVRMLFDSDRDGRTALTVVLRATCDLTGATEVPAEHPEMRRWERVTRVSRGYGGERHYTFPGGCITYRFDLRGGTRAEPVAAVSEALGFLRRQDLDDEVRRISGGRLRLDPTGGR